MQLNIKDALALVQHRYQTVRRDETASSRPRYGAYWRKIVFRGIASVTVALIANIAILAWAGSAYKGDIEDGAASVYQGSCDEMNRIDTWTHLAINVLSMLLLASSAQCMQCLAAPSRLDVDAAHAKHKWLDIGVPSARNLWYVSGWRSLLCACLALSSVPLSLIYNFIIFTSPAGQGYMAILVAPEFLKGAGFRASPNTDTSNSDFDPAYLGQIQKEVDTLEHMDNTACLDAYTKPFQTHYRNLLLVIEWRSNNDMVLYVISQPVDASRKGNPSWALEAKSHPDDWTRSIYFCDGKTRLAAQWAPNRKRDGGFYGGAGYQPPSTDDSHDTCTMSNAQLKPVRIQYCLAEKIPQPACSVKVSTTFLGVVIAFNVVKLVCMSSTLFLLNFQPLMTVGDAIASSLQRADPWTENQELLSASDVRKGKWLQHPGTAVKRRRWAQPPTRLYNAVTPIDWSTNLLVIFIVFIAGLVILLKVYKLEAYDGDIWGEGLGDQNPALMITMSIGLPLLAIVLIANLPQLAIAVAYFSYNTLLASMALGREYSRYSASSEATGERSRDRRANGGFLGKVTTSFRYFRHPRRLPRTTSDPAGKLALEIGTVPAGGLPLRVSEPVKASAQYATHTLSLPFIHNIPLQICMIALHWLVSQAIFVIQIQPYDYEGDEKEMISGCGWSIKGFIAAVAVSATMIITLLVLAVFGRMEKGIPVAGSCSAALASACPKRADDEGTELGRVTFGVLEEAVVDGKRVGRIGFGSGRLKPLREGQEYTTSPSPRAITLQ